ncbi:MAG: cation-translocating P-type ATPase [Candidatus Micrarchaeota archaeon]
MPETAVSYYSLSVAEALKKLDSNAEGLTTKDAAERLRKYGPNALKERKKRTVLDMFLDEFKDFVILLLMAAAIISAATTYFTNEGEYIDSAAILAIVVINAVIGVLQEYNANKAIEALRKLVQAKARVLRDGKEREIPTSDLVPGDIIIINEGDKIPADARLVESHNLEVEEASLTGESSPVEKKADVILDAKATINDCDNMVFMSTLVTKGTGKAVVCFTAESTEIGRIANLVQEIGDEQTPLQQKLETLGRQLGKLAIAATVLVFIVGTGRGLLGGGFEIKNVLDMFLIAVSLAVAAIPEGLPAVVTISLAIGVQRMAKRNSIIRRLPAAEGLGSATVICSDKTGTLTKNEMTVRRIFTNGKDFEITGQGYEAIGKFSDGAGKEIPNPLKEQNFCELFNSAILCNNAALAENSSIIGDPTEACLLVAAKKAGLDYLQEKQNRRKLDELTFDSNRKMMSVIYEEEEAGKIAYTKGAPEMLLEKCAYILKNGKMEKLGEEGKVAILRKNAEFASGGLRVLGFAFKMLKIRSIKEFKADQIENELVFIGLMAMMDSPRQEAKDAIAVCRKAGIKVVMITGDNELTARAVAKELGMFDEKKDRVLTGRKLEELSDAEFDKIVGSVTVYARVSPEHKMRIVTALQKKGEIVAMTGDGVNDAPAIKKSDIGVAMGITGTDVAKESADMVITDDNFASIVAAVEEGRIIFDNIMKSAKYLISCNIGEVLVIFVAIMLGWDSPLIPIQILWMNLATDALPALALAADTKARDIMNRRPRNPKESLISQSEMTRLAVIGILITIGTLGLFWFVNASEGLEKARTVAFSTIIFFQLFIALSWHAAGDMILKVGILKNKFLIFSVLLGFAMQIAIVQTGALEAVFKTVPLTAIDWIAISLVGGSIFIVEEMIKHAYNFRRTGQIM